MSKIPLKFPGGQWVNYVWESAPITFMLELAWESHMVLLLCFRCNFGEMKSTVCPRALYQPHSRVSIKSVIIIVWRPLARLQWHFAHNKPTQICRDLRDIKITKITFPFGCGDSGAHHMRNSFFCMTIATSVFQRLGGQATLHIARLCTGWYETFHISEVKVGPLFLPCFRNVHYCDAIMGTVASQITSLTIVYTTVYSDADQSKHQSSASLAFVWGIHRDRWIPRTNGQ